MGLSGLQGRKDQVLVSRVRKFISGRWSSFGGCWWCLHGMSSKCTVTVRSSMLYGFCQNWAPPLGGTPRGSGPRLRGLRREGSTPSCLTKILYMDFMSMYVNGFILKVKKGSVWLGWEIISWQCNWQTPCCFREGMRSRALIWQHGQVRWDGCTREHLVKMKYWCIKV